MARFKWNDKYFNDQINRASVDSVEESSKMLVSKIKNSMKEGINPSSPGEPPMVDTGLLRASITYQTSNGKFGGLQAPADFSTAVKPPGKKSKQDIGIIGSNVKYSEVLETGYAPRNLAPRPYLRPALAGSFVKILGIFGKKGRRIIKWMSYTQQYQQR